MSPRTRLRHIARWRRRLRLRRWLASGWGPCSLKGKLLLVSAALAVAAFGLTSRVLTRRSAEAAAEQARRHTGEILGIFAQAVAESVAAEDRLQVHVLARALLDNGVEAVLVVDHQGRDLVSSRAGLDDGGLYRAADRMPASGGVLGTTLLDGAPCLHMVRAVRFGDSPIGVAHIWVRKAELERTLLAAHAHVAPLLLGGFVLLAAIGAAILHAPFRSLRKLSRLAHDVGEGDLSGRVPVRGHDEVAGFCRVFNLMVARLEQARNEVLRKQLETIEAMINTVEAKDPYTQGHCLRVGGYARQILDTYDDIDRPTMFEVEAAAVLHDIGKIGIADHILLKKSKLTSTEARVIESHVTIGEAILSHLDSLRGVARGVRHHHERWDGAGYPDALAGDGIPFAARVIAVADTIDAMLTDRPYRKALSRRQVIELLEAERGRQFDPQIVDRAVALLAGASAGFHSSPPVEVPCDAIVS